MIENLFIVRRACFIDGRIEEKSKKNLEEISEAIKFSVNKGKAKFITSENPKARLTAKYIIDKTGIPTEFQINPSLGYKDRTNDSISLIENFINESALILISHKESSHNLSLEYKKKFPYINREIKTLEKGQCIHFDSRPGWQYINYHPD
jgi:hypothetical protein